MDFFDKKFRRDATQIFNKFWWVIFVAGILSMPKKTYTYTFTCNRLRIYNREKFQETLNNKANQIIKELNISFDDKDPGIKFEDVSLTTVGIIAIYKLNGKCINPNKILKGKLQPAENASESISLTKNEKILYYILGIEVYEYIKNLNFGSLGFYSEKVKNWEETKLHEQLKNYRDFLGLTDENIPEVEKAYDQIISKGHFP